MSRRTAIVPPCRSRWLFRLQTSIELDGPAWASTLSIHALCRFISAVSKNPDSKSNLSPRSSAIESLCPMCHILPCPGGHLSHALNLGRDCDRSPHSFQPFGCQNWRKAVLAPTPCFPLCYASTDTVISNWTHPDSACAYMPKNPAGDTPNC
mgnify:CR=1 FL=1